MGNEETVSLIKTTGSTSFKGLLLMGIEKYNNNTNTWDWVETLVNETNLRNVTSQNPMRLADVWSQNSWTTDDHANGTYRAYVALRDPYGNVLKNTTGYLNTTYEFALFSAKVNITVVNETGSQNHNSNIKIYDENGELVSSGWGTLSKAVDPFKLYNILIANTLSNGEEQVTEFVGVNITQDFQINPQIVENYTGNIPSGIANLTSIYAQEDLPLGYEYAQLTIPKDNLNVTYILHCTDWNFASANCNSWEVNKSSDYNMEENSTHIWFNVTEFEAYAGGEVIWLEVYLNTPPDNTVVPQYRNFTINATVICRGGNCGEVNGTVRYNASSTNPDTPISTVQGATPFWTWESNPQTCTLAQDENCTMVWKVNSTGELRNGYKVGVLFEVGTTQNHTLNSTVTIGKVIIISLSWDETDFGVCDPNTQGNPALLNDQLEYNMTVDPNSNDVEGLWTKGTDLTPESISGFGSIEYWIGVGNVSWNDMVNDYSDIRTERLSSEYKLVRQVVPSGSTITFYYWIDIPPGMYEQTYNGQLFIMANASW